MREITKGRRLLTTISALLLLFAVCSCTSPIQNEDTVNYTSFRDIPGVTEEEIRAIESFQRQGVSFVYGAMPNTEAFIDVNGEIRGFAVILKMLEDGDASMLSELVPWIISAVGLVFCVLVLVFYLYFRSKKFVKIQEESESKSIFLANMSHEIRPPMILVVDDLPVNLKVAEGLLSPYKAKVDTCLSGEEAVELVKQNKYDVVFMDHMMPGMDGMEATSRIREFNKEVPIVALTANAVVGMKEKFIENGFNDFLPKPINVLKLDEVLEQWIGKKFYNEQADYTAQEIKKNRKVPDLKAKFADKAPVSGALLSGALLKQREKKQA